MRVAPAAAGPSPTAGSSGSPKSFEPRIQLHVDPVLSLLADYRATSAEGQACFCVMGITMEDLYSSPSDLFVAGMAAGGSNVAVFSFHRYVPVLKARMQTLS